jgi:hypothetical protein
MLCVHCLLSDNVQKAALSNLGSAAQQLMHQSATAESKFSFFGEMLELCQLCGKPDSLSQSCIVLLSFL